MKNTPIKTIPKQLRGIMEITLNSCPNKRVKSTKYFIYMGRIFFIHKCWKNYEVSEFTTGIGVTASGASIPTINDAYENAVNRLNEKAVTASNLYRLIKTAKQNNGYTMQAKYSNLIN